MRTAYFTHPACRAHVMDPQHPESPARLEAIERALTKTGLARQLARHEAPRAGFEELARVHSRDYLEYVRRRAPEEGTVELDPDVTMNPHTLEAALRAAGALIAATDSVLGGDAEAAFCAVRPPGHHAESARAMGFCLFNNVAVGMAHALEVHGLKRVAIVDFDVHHGNGTEEIFRDEARVLMCSTYQWPLYPNVPAQILPGRLINLALRPGTGGEGLRAAFVQHWRPALESFRPQMLFVSAGFDGHREDPLAALNFEDADYGWITEALVTTMSELGSPRIVSTLEGGYALAALGRSVAAHVQALVDG